MKFTNESIKYIFDKLELELNSLEVNQVVEFEVLNPDVYMNKYSGEKVFIQNKEFIYRDLNSWNDLAQKLFCKMLLPMQVDEYIVKIRFKKLDMNRSFHKQLNSNEKYGVESEFFYINKNEEPEIFLTYFKALQSVKANSRKRVLNLGVNDGSEFKVIKENFESFCDIEFVGIDYCQSAIDEAKQNFKENTNVKFYCHDINQLDSLDLGSFDLIISIGTFQSSNLNFNEIFMKIIQKYLKKDGAIILGFPNCRWVDGQLLYGAKASNYSYSEMSVLYKDVIFCKKYLQQKKFRVTLTGKYYIFLTGTSIRK